LTAARDYGIVRLSLGDAALGGPLDRYHDGVVTDELDLGVVELPAGEATLGVEIAGSNEAAEPRHMFGLDCLLLEPANRSSAALAQQLQRAAEQAGQLAVVHRGARVVPGAGQRVPLAVAGVQQPVEREHAGLAAALVAGPLEGLARSGQAGVHGEHAA